MTEEAEILDQELEVAGDSAIMNVKQDSAQDIFWLADNIDRVIEAQKKIFASILKVTIPGDFVAFKGRGDKETVELTGAACERIARDIGISFINWTDRREDLNDEKGVYYRYVYECDAVFRSRIIRAMGVVSSRSKFFGKDQGAFKEIWEVDRDSVQKAARREAIKEGVKSLLGLRHLNRQELEKYGVVIQGTGGHDFKSRDDKAGEMQTVTVKIAEIRRQTKEATATTKGWTKFNILDVEGGTYSTFSESLAKMASEAKKADKAATLTFHKSQYGNEVDSLVA